jgi:hypothetical protein
VQLAAALLVPSVGAKQEGLFDRHVDLRMTQALAAPVRDQVIRQCPAMGVNVTAQFRQVIGGRHNPHCELKSHRHLTSTN